MEPERRNVPSPPRVQTESIFTNFRLVYKNLDQKGYIKLFTGNLSSIFQDEIDHAMSEVNSGQIGQFEREKLLRVIEKNVLIFKENVKMVLSFCGWLIS